MKMKTTSFNRVFCAGMILICAAGVSRGQGSRIEKVLDSTRNSLTTQALPFDVEDGMFDPATGNFFGYAKAKVDAPNFSSNEFVRAVVASAQSRFKPVDAWLAFVPSKMILRGDRLILFNRNSFKVYDATNFKPLAGFSVRQPGRVSFNGNVMKIGVMQIDLDQLSPTVSSATPLIFREGILRDGLLYRDAKPVLNLGNVTQSQAERWGLNLVKVTMIDIYNRDVPSFGISDEKGNRFGYKDIPFNDKGLFIRVYNSRQVFASIHAAKARGRIAADVENRQFTEGIGATSPQGRPQYSDLKTAFEKVILSKARLIKEQDFTSAFESTPICAVNGESIYMVVGNQMFNWSAEKLINKYKKQDLSKPEFKKRQDTFVFTDPVHRLTHEIVGGKAPFQFKLIGSDPFLQVDPATGVVSFAHEKYVQQFIQRGLQASEMKASFIQDYKIRTAEETKWAKEKLGLQTKGMHRKIPIGLRATDANGNQATIHYNVIACVDLEPHFPAIDKIKKRYTSPENLKERLLKLEKQFEFLSRE